VFVIYAVLLLIAMMLTRASFRLVGEFVQRQRQSGRRVAIYGAGDAGGLVVRELLNQDGDEVRIVGFVDDDPRKAGIRVMGYAVLGGYSALTVLIKAASIDEVVVSARTMPPERLNNLQVLCAESRIRLARLHVGLEALVDEDAGADIPARHPARKTGS
jgi:UDP-GlcNAc:undecaprenyl-phosphate GlcNAc-1-phosphate transferase